MKFPEIRQKHPSEFSLPDSLGYEFELEVHDLLNLFEGASAFLDDFPDSLFL